MNKLEPFSDFQLFKNYQNHFPNQHLKDIDPQIFELCAREWQRQEFGIELIASENYTSKAVMEAQGSLFTNKYAEGYPGKRYYGGCQWVDEMESLCIERFKQVFSCQFANVQPHSGSSANFSVYGAILKPGDKILGMDLSQGGHLTHGHPANFSGQLYQTHFYGLQDKTESIDYEDLRNKALEIKPKLIIAGASAYPLIIDFKIFREVADECGALLLVDMAHIAGLVATGLHPSPFPYAHVVTSTTHKTLRGPRGGIILTNDESLSKKIHSQVFPGMQGGPLEHIIAAKAVCALEALSPGFKKYQQQVLANAQTLAKEFQKLGVPLVGKTTENHLLLLKMDPFSISGRDAEKLLDEVGITTNKNTIPKETRSPMVTSGIRLGTPAVTTRGFKEKEMISIAHWIFKLLDSAKNAKLTSDPHSSVQLSFETLKIQIQQEVLELARRYPVYSA